MPNYTKLEEQLLGATERALTEQSRAPVLGTLDDAGIYRLIAQLGAAQAAADATPKDDGRSAVDLLAAALRRVHAERRKRGLKPQADAANKPAAKTAAKPAAAAKISVPRAPASPARKPAGRAKAEARKNDLRTGSHRVTKRNVKADPVADGAVEAPAASEIVLSEADAQETSPKKAAKANKAAEKAAKEARKATKKADKEAEKAAKKVAKKAAKDADKAAKKAARKAEKAAGADTSKTKDK